MYNPNKTVTASSKGIIISFRDCNKHKYLPYQSKTVENIQQNGTAKYQELEIPVFNSVQQKLFAERLYGLSIYKPEELVTFSKKKKSNILIIYKRVQHFLNKWKQEIVNNQMDNLLIKLFPKSHVIKHMCSVKGYDRGFRSKHTFKELGITDDKIAIKLIEGGFLPANFFQLA